MTKPAPSAVLDLSILIAMYGDDSARTITLALSGFRKEASTYMQQLQAALRHNAQKDIARLSHSLKSMSGLVGALHLAQLCQNLEQSVRQHDDAALASNATELGPVWLELQAALNSSLQQHGHVDD